MTVFKDTAFTIVTHPWTFQQRNQKYSNAIKLRNVHAEDIECKQPDNKQRLLSQQRAILGSRCSDNNHILTQTRCQQDLPYTLALVINNTTYTSNDNPHKPSSDASQGRRSANALQGVLTNPVPPPCHALSFSAVRCAAALNQYLKQIRMFNLTTHYTYALDGYAAHLQGTLARTIPMPPRGCASWVPSLKNDFPASSDF